MAERQQPLEGVTLVNLDRIPPGVKNAVAGEPQLQTGAKIYKTYIHKCSRSDVCVINIWEAVRAATERVDNAIVTF